MGHLCRVQRWFFPYDFQIVQEEARLLTWRLFWPWMFGHYYLSILWVGCFIFSVCSAGSTRTISRSSKKKPSTGIDTMRKTLNGKQRWCLCLMGPHWRLRNVGDCKWHNFQEKGRSILVSHSILLDLNPSLPSKRVSPLQPSHGILHEEQAWSIHAEGPRVRGNRHVTNRELTHPLIIGFLNQRVSSLWLSPFWLVKSMCCFRKFVHP